MGAMKRHEPGPMSRDALMGLLTGHGEKMSEEELERCFEALVGEPSIHRVLDDEVDALDFARNVLGLADFEEVASEEPALALEGGPSTVGAGRSEMSALEGGRSA